MYDVEIAARMSRHLSDQGLYRIAEILLDDARTTLVRRDTPYLRVWAVYEIAFDGAAYPVRYEIATSERESRVLSGEPTAFAEMLRADPGRVGDPETATAVAVDYLTITPAQQPPTRLVRSTGDIRLWPEVERHERSYLDTELGDVVHPPRAERHDDAYTVVAFLVHRDELQRRTVRVTGDGAITETSETVAEDLPILM